MPADPIVLRRFHVPLRLRPGDVALYSLLQEPDGRTWLRWDGVRRSTRIPPEYASRSPSHSDDRPRHGSREVRTSPDPPTAPERGSDASLSGS